MQYRLVIFFFLLLIIAIPSAAQKKLSNELIWNSAEFSASFVDGLNSMNDGLYYTQLEESDAFGTQIVKYSYQTGEKEGVIVSAKEIFGSIEKTIDGYEWSADEKKLLIQTETEPIYRWSSKSHYYVYDTEKKNGFPLSDDKLGKQRLAEFSPDGKKIAFVRDNNLFLLDIVSKKEKQVTVDGSMNSIINGGTDWVYEEEFGFDKGFYWSPKSDRIAYYRFDESAVREYGMDMYGQLYPSRYDFKYPKAGEKNSIVSIYIYNLVKNNHSQVDTGENTDTYIPRIKWTKNNDQLCVMRMNRHQNKLEFLLTDLSKSEPFAISTRIIYTENSETYIDITDHLLFLKDGETFIWLSERNDYNHLYQYDLNGHLIKQLTTGLWDVIDFYGMDEEKGIVYYSSSEVSPMEKHIYALEIKKGKTNRLDCCTGMNEASFSKGMKYMILENSNANTPPVYSLLNSKGEEIRVLIDNKKLKENLSTYRLTKKEFFNFKNSDGTSLNCWMMKPVNFDPSKKHPVLVAIYGGPGNNTVTDAWSGRTYLWHQLLCQEGYIVVSCDPRGTQFRGRKFKHSTYMNLGKNETEDFIDLAKYLGNQSYIDKSRIGMQGWSYGGYMTSLCMTKGADYYTAGIAVAPVTNWKYYDSIYTERFMRTPQENNGGYENNSPINFAQLLKGKYLLIHGSADDNVHLQNTMDMVTALVKANKQFDLFIYPNKNHGIYGGNTRLHLYTLITDFLKANL
ncbi:MAG: DPP IV N-terminal domain-containing protein [Crocinitomicaceae bacterium]|nr:DPP IV N-terminal domain-containing protein [Crocinitomicaceae bacterium]